MLLKKRFLVNVLVDRATRARGNKSNAGGRLRTKGARSASPPRGASFDVLSRGAESRAFAGLAARVAPFQWIRMRHTTVRPQRRSLTCAVFLVPPAFCPLVFSRVRQQRGVGGGASGSDGCSRRVCGPVYVALHKAFSGASSHTPSGLLLPPSRPPRTGAGPPGGRVPAYPEAGVVSRKNRIE